MQNYVTICARPMHLNSAFRGQSYDGDRFSTALISKDVFIQLGCISCTNGCYFSLSAAENNAVVFGTIVEFGCNEIFLPPNALHNLGLRGLYDENFAVKLVISPMCSMPLHTAQSIEVSKICGYSYDDDRDLEISIQRFFSIPRRVMIGDILTISSLKLEKSSVMTLHNCNVSDKLTVNYFVVTDLSSVKLSVHNESVVVFVTSPDSTKVNLRGIKATTIPNMFCSNIAIALDVGDTILRQRSLLLSGKSSRQPPRNT